MDYKDAEAWFTDLWNYSIVPYVLEAVRDEVQVRLSNCDFCQSLSIIAVNFRAIVKATVFIYYILGTFTFS